jgi:hypothetical protein
LPDPESGGTAPAREPGIPEPGIPPAPRPRRKHRRVTTPPPPGSDPTPLEEPDRHAEGENDQRLREDKPPHY